MDSHWVISVCVSWTYWIEVLWSHFCVCAMDLLWSHFFLCVMGLLKRSYEVISVYVSETYRGLSYIRSKNNTTGGRWWSRWDLSGNIFTFIFLVCEQLLLIKRVIWTYWKGIRVRNLSSKAVWNEINVEKYSLCPTKCMSVMYKATQSSSFSI